MSRRAIVVSLALHASLLLLIVGLAPSTRLGPGHAEIDGAFLADDAAGALVTPPAPSSESASEPEFAAPEFIPPAPVVVPSAPPVSPVAKLPTQLPLVIGSLPEMPAAALKVSASKSGKTAPRATGRLGGGAGRRQGLGSAGGGGGQRAAGYAPPQFLVRYKPTYPEEARAQRLEGTVLLLVAIDAAGRVTDASLLRSCGHAVLDRAGLAAVWSWRFNPARQDGVAIAARVEVPVRFRFD